MSQVIADYFKTQPGLKIWLFGSFDRGEETYAAKSANRDKRMIRELEIN